MTGCNVPQWNGLDLWSYIYAGYTCTHIWQSYIDRKFPLPSKQLPVVWQVERRTGIHVFPFRCWFESLGRYKCFNVYDCLYYECLCWYVIVLCMSHCDTLLCYVTDIYNSKLSYCILFYIMALWSFLKIVQTLRCTNTYIAFHKIWLNPRCTPTLKRRWILSWFESF